MASLKFAHVQVYFQTQRATFRMAESISLEETNKIRISLGLKPLTDDAAPADTKEQTAEDNFTRRREQEVHQRERKYIHLAHCLSSFLFTCGIIYRRIEDGIAK